MRGALVAWDGTLHGGRIIPADAESTFLRMRGLSAGPDHPRGCGEHGWRAAPGWLVSGSSPRMRGARRISGDYPRMVGIIPADAGSTLSSLMTFSGRKDHPRGCGEHILGSRAVRLAWLEFGIIPADAGSTQASPTISLPTTDHPRGCGEHGVPWSWPSKARGSSPRMRGARCRP